MDISWCDRRVSIRVVPLVFVLCLAPVRGFLLSALPRVNSYTFPTGVTLSDGLEYEYIVVGAGAAGAAAAARLALAGRDVLLLEAGGDPHLISKIPMASMGLLGSPLDWQYKTIPNNVSCLSSQGKQCRFSRGKALGGSSTINYMLYVRGNRRDYDRANYKEPGWTWKDLKPYFLKYEGLRVLDQLPAYSAPYHNTTGNMRLEFFDDPQNPWHSRIMEGFESLNFPNNRDINGKSQIGVSKMVGWVYRGERMSTARGYLAREDVKSRLKVAKFAFCTGVIIDDDNVARGVTVVQGSLNITLKLYARREVVLCAGAIGTPQILMLSGVGPADHLKEMGIPVRVNLTVGDDMSDHVLPLMVVRVDRGSSVAANLAALAARGLQLAQFLTLRGGPLASNGLSDIVAFYSADCYESEGNQLSNVSAACSRPTIQVIFSYIDRNLVPLAKPLFKQAIGLDDDIIEQLSEANGRYALMVVSPIVLRPYSRGSVRLATADPRAPPAILPNYLADPRDLDQMVKAIGLVEDLVETPAFRQHNASILHLKLEGCPAFEADRAAYWACYARHLTYPVYHAVGTCALGRVLDAALRVRGVRRLRVADTAAVPALPRGNTEAVAVAFGERVADFLLEDATKQLYDNN